MIDEICNTTNVPIYCTGGMKKFRPKQFTLTLMLRAPLVIHKFAVTWNLCYQKIHQKATTCLQHFLHRKVQIKRNCWEASRLQREISSWQNQEGKILSDWFIKKEYLKQQQQVYIIYYWKQNQIGQSQLRATRRLNFHQLLPQGQMRVPHQFLVLPQYDPNQIPKYSEICFSPKNLVVFKRNWLQMMMTRMTIHLPRLSSETPDPALTGVVKHV